MLPKERNVWVLCNYAETKPDGSRTRTYQVLRGSFIESLAMLWKIFSPPEDFIFEIIEIGLSEDIERRGASMNEICVAINREDGSMVGEMEYWGEEKELKF
ncbi:MAG: hypothetical protein DWQ19_10300 [Crenarchaeota archaeon]|nr:MAG: hypothetical protein DWQ19_10300 [Thermoproteota archaeon]